MTTVIEAINDLIRGVNLAFSRNAYSMQETRTLINAIEFIGDTIKSQQEQQQDASGIENLKKEEDITF